jgi:hypothetical protein
MAWFKPKKGGKALSSRKEKRKEQGKHTCKPNDDQCHRLGAASLL